MKNIIILGFLFTFLFSDAVNLERAMTVAQNFSNARISSFNLDSIETIEENSTVYFYIFRLENRGFLIVSANDYAMPILAYSFDNIFSNDLPIQVEYLFNLYKNNIDSIIDDEINPGLAMHGGYISIHDFDEENRDLKLTMGGGCQGCASSRVSMAFAVERHLMEVFPEIREIEDVTDHLSGENPYYT